MHARIELVEGLAMVAGGFALAGLTGWQQIALCVLGASQIGAAAIGDARPPKLAQ